MSNAARSFAIVLAVAAIVPPWAMTLAMGGSGGGGAVVAGGEVTFSYGEVTTAARVVALALGCVIAAGAAGLWAARARVWRGLALVVAVLGCVLTPLAVAAARPGVVTAAEQRTIRPGMSMDQVKAIAGRPSGSGAGTAGDGRELECMVYAPAGFDRPPLFCFAGDRLVKVER